jgi:hypothetical protein
MNRTSRQCHTDDNWQRMARQAEAAPQYQPLDICPMVDRKHAAKQLNREDLRLAPKGDSQHPEPAPENRSLVQMTVS